MEEFVLLATSMKCSGETLTSAPTTTNDLYAKWLAGDGDRTETLLRMRKLLITHATRVCWNVLHQDNEHLVIEMVDDLLMELDKFNGKSKFSTYAHARFRFRCIDEFRYQVKNLGEALKASKTEWNENSMLAKSVDPDVYIGVSDYLDSLPVREREIVEARLEGHTFKEISALTNIPVTTVKRIWDARAGGVDGSA